MPKTHILQGDARQVLRGLPNASVQCVVTSPPYFGLRDYQTASWEGGDAGCDHTQPGTVRSAKTTLINSDEYKARSRPVYPGVCGKCGARRADAQLGLESSPDAYVAEMVAVFREVRRVLRDDGTVWLNLGDAYSSGQRTTQCNPSGFTGTARLADGGARRVPAGIAKPKDLLMIPARVALALQADGWWLRSDIIWAKPNPMPESVTDRPTSAHEHVFLLSKRASYYYDADAVAEAAETFGRQGSERGESIGTKNSSRDTSIMQRGTPDRYDQSTRNLRNVWSIATQPYSGSHFATMPPDLAERCIKAGTSERGQCPHCASPWARMSSRGAEQPVVAPSGLDRYGTGEAGVHRKVGGQYQKWLDANPLVTTGWQPTCSCPEHAPVPQTVLDPFAGAFTTAMVADRLGRSSIGIELNPDYCRIARERITRDAGMFANLTEQAPPIPPAPAPEPPLLAFLRDIAPALIE